MPKSQATLIGYLDKGSLTVWQEYESENIFSLATLKFIESNSLIYAMSHLVCKSINSEFSFSLPGLNFYLTINHRLVDMPIIQRIIPKNNPTVQEKRTLRWK